ncbi:hypothetical protein M0P98_00980 [bacterium]|nr:hypothetical protein [bacterium]
MKQVTLEDFKTPVYYKQAKDIVFSGEKDGTDFKLGFLPESEFVYSFDTAPDVFFQDLDIEEVYYEPYRTFLRLKYPTDLKIYLRGGDKLYVKGNLRV